MKANGDNKINTLGKLPFPKKIFSYFYFKFQQNTVLWLYRSEDNWTIITSPPEKLADFKRSFLPGVMKCFNDHPL